VFLCKISIFGVKQKIFDNHWCKIIIFWQFNIKLLPMLNVYFSLPDQLSASNGLAVPENLELMIKLEDLFTLHDSWAHKQLKEPISTFMTGTILQCKKNNYFIHKLTKTLFLCIIYFPHNLNCALLKTKEFKIVILHD
jgi:hypothetical protein